MRLQHECLTRLCSAVAPSTEPLEQRLFAGNLLIPTAGGMLSALDAGQRISAGPGEPTALAAPESTTGITDSSSLSAAPPLVSADEQTSGAGLDGSASDSGSAAATTGGSSADASFSPPEFSAADAPLGWTADTTAADGGTVATTSLPEGFLDDVEFIPDGWHDEQVTDPTDYIGELDGITSGDGDSAFVWLDGEGQQALLAGESSGPLSAPANVVATAETNNRVRLTWIDNSTDETAFLIERSTDQVNWGQWASVAANATTYFSTTHAANTSYWYRLRAVNALEQSSLYSSLAATHTTTAAPAQPSNLSATAEPLANQINLTWTDNNFVETGYLLERSSSGAAATWNLVADIPGNTTAYADTGLVPGATYYYRLKCYGEAYAPATFLLLGATSGNGNGSITVARGSQAPADPPAMVSDLGAEAVGSGQVALTWRNDSLEQAGLLIERSGDGGQSFSAIATLAADATSYGDDPLSPDSTRFYRVVAAYASGYCAYSPMLGVRTLAAPSGLSLTPVSSTRIDLSWQAPASIEGGFVIERKGQADGDYAPIASVAANVTTYSDNGLAAATSYAYRVRSVRDDGASSQPSGSQEAATFATGAPSHLVAEALSTSSIRLTWQDNGFGGHFAIQMSTNGVEFSHLASVPSNGIEQTWTVSTGFSEGEACYFRVRAYSGTTESDWSNTVRCITQPAAPTGVSAQAANESEINVSWSDASHAEDSFLIEMSADEQFNTVLLSGTAAANACHYAFVGLTPPQVATSYYFRVAAVQEGVQSAWSAEPGSAQLSGASQELWQPVAGPVTPDIYSGDPAYFLYQSHFAPGTYRIRWVKGAVNFLKDQPNWWGVRTGVKAQGGLEGGVRGPGVGRCADAAAAAQAAAALNLNVRFQHAGGWIAAYLDDDPYYDNAPGNPNSSFVLERLMSSDSSAPRVSVTATRAAGTEGADEPDDQVQFTISTSGYAPPPPVYDPHRVYPMWMSQWQNEGLPIYFTLSGTAAPNSVFIGDPPDADYTGPFDSGTQWISGGYRSVYCVTLLPGQFTQTLTFHISDDEQWEPDESVVLSLYADDLYRIVSPSSATATIQNHGPTVDSTTVSDHAFPSNAITASTGATRNLYVGEPDGGVASIDVEASVVPANEAGQVAWALARVGDTTGFMGTFSDGPIHGLPLLSDEGVRCFTFTAGPDVNRNGLLDEGEATRRVDIHLVSLQSLMVLDLNDPDGAVVADSRVEQHVGVMGTSPDYGTVLIEPEILPDEQAARQRVLWSLDYGGGTAATGTFEAGETVVDVAPQEGNYSPVLTAGFDFNGNGMLEGGEVSRTVYVHLADVPLVVRDQTHPAWAVRSTADDPKDLYLPVQEGSGAVIELVLAPQPGGDADFAPVTLWSVTTDEGLSVAAGSFASGLAVPVSVGSDVGGWEFIAYAGLDYNGDGVLQSSEVAREVSVHLFRLEFTRTYSDQFADSPANYLDGHAGHATNAYMLMGARSDDRAYVRTSFALTCSDPDIRSQLLFDLVSTTYSSPRAPAFSVEGDVVRVNAPVPSGWWPESMKVVAGFDYDGDGRLSTDEAAIWSPHLLKVVGEADYEKALTVLDGIRAGWSTFGWGYAANFMYSFENNMALSGATEQWTTLLPDLESRYSHYVGAAYNTEGTAQVRYNVFSPESPLALDIADSSEMRALIRSSLPLAEISNAFENEDPRQGPIREFQWQLGADSINFASGDLKYAIAHADLRGTDPLSPNQRPTVKASIQYLVHTDNEGWPVGEEYYNVLSVQVIGGLNDFYDFNLEDRYPVPEAAIVQAGYDTLGIAGRVFYVDVNLETFVRSWWSKDLNDILGEAA